jgi:hypothetical protein
MTEKNPRANVIPFRRRRDASADAESPREGKPGAEETSTNEKALDYGYRVNPEGYGYRNREAN